jgi:hypothetical protein
LEEPHKEKKVGITKGEENYISPSKTKKEGFMDHINITYQVLEEGIENTFIFEKSFSLY